MRGSERNLLRALQTEIRCDTFDCFVDELPSGHRVVGDLSQRAARSAPEIAEKKLTSVPNSSQEQQEPTDVTEQGFVNQ